MHHRFMAFGFQRFHKTQSGQWIDVRRSGLFGAGIVFMRQAHKGRCFNKLLIALAGHQRNKLALKMFGIGTGSDNAARSFIADRQGLVETRAHGINKLRRHGGDHFLLIAVRHQLAF